MSKRTHLTISMPEPCGVPWQDMRSVDEYRRHCASCAKIVTDFTAMSDAEIVSYLQANATQHPCGRFTQEQLNRPMQMLPEKTQKAVWWKAAVLLPLSLWSKHAFAQQHTETPDSSRTAAHVSGQAASNDSTAAVPATKFTWCTLPDTVSPPFMGTQITVNLDSLTSTKIISPHVIVTSGLPMINYHDFVRWDIPSFSYSIVALYTPVYDSVVRARDSVYEALKVKLWGKNTVENAQPFQEPEKPELPDEEKIVALEPPRRFELRKK